MQSFTRAESLPQPKATLLLVDGTETPNVTRYSMLQVFVVTGVSAVLLSRCAFCALSGHACRALQAGMVVAVVGALLH